MFIYQFTCLVTIFLIFRPNRPDYKQRFSSIFFSVRKCFTYSSGEFRFDWTKIINLSFTLALSNITMFPSQVKKKRNTKTSYGFCWKCFITKEKKNRTLRSKINGSPIVCRYDPINIYWRKEQLALDLWGYSKSRGLKILGVKIKLA